MPEYVSLGFGIAGYKLAFQIQIAHELPHRERKSGKLGPRLEKKAVLPDRCDHPAWALGSFQDAWLQPQLLQAVSTSQPGNPRSDYDDIFCVSHRGQYQSKSLKLRTSMDSFAP